MQQRAGEPLRVGFVDGVVPDKWARRWADRRSAVRLELVPLAGRDGVRLLHDRELAMCFLRLPVEVEGLHLVRLYDEQPVVVVAREHPAAVFDEVHITDLADEPVLTWPVDVRAALDVVVAEAGVLVIPHPVARLHRRRDVAAVPLTGVPATAVGLAWPRGLDAADEELAQQLVGVVRGRTRNSSRQ